MEYSELLPIILVIVVVGFGLSSSSFIERKIASEQARFRSATRCVVALGVIAASYALLALPSAIAPPVWYFALGATLSFVAPTLAWFVSRGGPARWLRVTGALGFTYPIAFFVCVAMRRG